MEKPEKLTGEYFVEDMTAAERDIARRVEQVLPALEQAAARADETGEFPVGHIRTFQEAGLPGLVVPREYGGLGGGLRDLCAATFALATVCPSTAMTYFFHCSGASRGLLPLEAIDAGLFTKEEEPQVRFFAERLLRRMGDEGLWMANFASETGKSSEAAITILTEAKKEKGGWRLNGVKSFGCATGVAHQYIVTARMEGAADTNGLAVFIVDAASPGVRVRGDWNTIGMRATASNGIILEDVFVPDEDALAIDGAFTRMMTVSRGSFVGNQVAGIAVYLGAAWSLYRHIIRHLQTQKFRDTGAPIGEAPFQLQLVGEMTRDLQTAMLWMQRQLQLEASDPPPLPKEEVVRQWRLCKGEAAEAAFRVAGNAFKAGGTSGTDNNGVIVRLMRDLSMGLVQAFPAERGRLEAARMVIAGAGQPQFGLG